VTEFNSRPSPPETRMNICKASFSVVFRGQNHSTVYMSTQLFDFHVDYLRQ
jgi:hypothetical protein